MAEDIEAWMSTWMEAWIAAMEAWMAKMEDRMCRVSRKYNEVMMEEEEEVENLNDDYVFFL